MATRFDVGGLGSSVQRRKTPVPVLETWSCDGRMSRWGMNTAVRTSHLFVNEACALASHAAMASPPPITRRKRGICPLHLTCQDVSGECGGRGRQRGLLAESPRICPLKITLLGSIRIIRCVFWRHQPTEPSTVLTLTSAATGSESRNACDRSRC